MREETLESDLEVEAMYKPGENICMSFDDLLLLVSKQAEDLGLWGHARTAEEEYLQMALRELHYEIERLAGLDEFDVEEGKE